MVLSQGIMTVWGKINITIPEVLPAVGVAEYWEPNRDCQEITAIVWAPWALVRDVTSVQFPKDVRSRNNRVGGVGWDFSDGSKLDWSEIIPADIIGLQLAILIFCCQGIILNLNLNSVQTYLYIRI